MTLEVKTLDKQHHDYVQWLSDLSFHKDELSQFEQQLQQLIVRSNKELLPRFEHFQNNFIRQHEVVDELSHEIGIVDQHLISVRDGAPSLVVDQVLDHDQISAKMETFHKLYRDLKSEYLEFLALW